MAFATTDVYLEPSDGWVLVATNPVKCLIRASDNSPFWVAVTASGAPAAGLEGLKFGRGGDGQRETFELSGATALTCEVYIRIKEPGSSHPGSTRHFGVIVDA